MNSTRSVIVNSTENNCKIYVGAVTLVVFIFGVVATFYPLIYDSQSTCLQVIYHLPNHTSIPNESPSERMTESDETMIDDDLYIGAFMVSAPWQILWLFIAFQSVGHPCPIRTRNFSMTNQSV